MRIVGVCPWRRNPGYDVFALVEGVDSVRRPGLIGERLLETRLP